MTIVGELNAKFTTRLHYRSDDGGIEDKMAGVLRAEASYQKGLMTVEYNETQVNEAQIKAAILHLGYTVSTINPTDK